MSRGFPAKITAAQKIEMFGMRRQGMTHREIASHFTVSESRVQQILSHWQTSREKRRIWLTLTYDRQHLPADYSAAIRDSSNYIRRLRRAHAASGSAEPLRYAIVTEMRDADGQPVRAHHHIVVNFRDRDAAEKLWTKGGRTQSRRLQPDNYEYTGLANYLGKPGTTQDGTKVTRRWRASRNLKRPRITTADKKITRRRVDKLTTMSEQERAQIFERLYPGCRYLDCKIR